MSKRSTSKTGLSLLGDLQGMVPRPALFPDEDPVTYEGLRAALINDLAPGTSYERVLAENLACLEWEMIRHRRMRDSQIRAEARRLARNFSATGSLSHRYDIKFTSDDEKFGADFVSSDRSSADQVRAEIERHGVSIEELVARAYSCASESVETHEEMLAGLEIRRRRLREDFDKLKAARAKPIEEAEVVG